MSAVIFGVSAGTALTTAAAGVGLASGLKSLTSGGGGGGGATGAQQQYDPYGPYRAQAASQLQNVMQNPALAMAQPGYQQQLQQGTQATERGLAARGGIQSGQEQAALQTLGQNTFGSFYNSLTSQLEQLSGATQAPAQANLAAQQGASSQFGLQSGALGQVTSGLGGLASIYNSSNPYSNMGLSGSNSAGYTYTDPSSVGPANPGITGPFIE